MPPPEPPRGPKRQRIGVLIEDALILLSLAYLMAWLFLGLSGTTGTILMYATLAAMAVVAVRRFLRIKRVDEPKDEKKENPPQ